MNLCYTTFSIVARDPSTGQLGIAIASRPVCVGSLCPVIQHGLGAVVTQAWTNPYLPARVFERLALGAGVADALDEIMAEEPDADLRQVGVVDAHGRAAAFTGARTTPFSGHRIGDQVTVQGNMLASEAVLDAMLSTFEASSSELAGRLLRALAAGAASGGDVRGQRSAALKVFESEDYPLIDLRIDDHDTPIEALGGLWRVFEKDMLPYRRAQPTRENPRGRFEDVRTAFLPSPAGATGSSGTIRPLRPRAR